MKSLAGTPSTPARLEKMRSHAPPLDPAPETVVERLLRHVDVFRTVAPTASALQRVDNPGEHASVINPRHPARILRQDRSGSIRVHCSSGNQKKFAIQQLAGDL